MSFPFESNVVAAVTLLRIVTGILFFFQGYDKIFNVKIPNVISAFVNPYASNLKIPTFMLKPAVVISSWTEFIGGAFLILGLFKGPVLYVLGANMLFVALAFSIIKPMWDMQHYFPRILFIVLLLLIPFSWDVFALDNLLF